MQLLILLCSPKNFFPVVLWYILYIGPEWDSSDDEVGDEVELPTQQDKVATKKGKGKKIDSRPQKSNVIYIGHLPKDCQERELIGFLKQFGRLSQLRLCRSHKTGGTKGYAFARFEDSEVAAIVADTMNGYLLFGKRMVCHVVPPEQLHGKIFSSKNRTVFQRRSEKPREPQSLKKMKETTKDLISKERKKKAALKAMGIDYDFPGYEASLNSFKSEANHSEGDEEEMPEKKKDMKMEKKEKEKGGPITPESSKKKQKKDKHDKDVKGGETSGQPQSEKKAKKEKKKRRKTT